MTLHEWFKFNETTCPELTDVIKKREELADKCAELDAPVMNKSVEELRKIYLELFLNICTDKTLSEFEQSQSARQGVVNIVGNRYEASLTPPP